MERVPLSAIDVGWLRAEHAAGRPVRLARTIDVSIVEPHVEQTAYGMPADMVAIHQGRRLIPSPLLPPQG